MTLLANRILISAELIVKLGNTLTSALNQNSILNINTIRAI